MSQHKKNASEWSYVGETGPLNWGKICENANGKHQSPINIENRLSSFDTKLATTPLTFTYNDQCFKNIENTGSSFNVTGTSDAVSCVKGGPVSSEYKFLQFHIHWGANDNEGSEHLIDGKAYAAELHIVNWNSQLYSSPAEAVKSNKHDGLIVLGILLKAGKANSEINRILPALNEISLKGQKSSINENLNLRNLFPDTSSYWTYQGSLTTPPCSECVQWVVFKEPVEVSSEQLNTFRNLYHCSDSSECCASNKINFNFRPICELNDRKITKSFD